MPLARNFKFSRSQASQNCEEFRNILFTQKLLLRLENTENKKIFNSLIIFIYFFMCFVETTEWMMMNCEFTIRNCAVHRLNRMEIRWNPFLIWSRFVDFDFHYSNKCPKYMYLRKTLFPSPNQAHSPLPVDVFGSSQWFRFFVWKKNALE